MYRSHSSKHADYHAGNYGSKWLDLLYSGRNHASESFPADLAQPDSLHINDNIGHAERCICIFSNRFLGGNMPVTTVNGAAGTIQVKLGGGVVRNVTGIAAG